MNGKRPLTDQMRQAIHLMVMDRWGNTKSTTATIVKELGITTATVNKWRKRTDFIAEYNNQVEQYKSNFDDVRLADRKERVKVLSDLFDALSEKAAGTKLQVLEAIRREVGDDKITHEHKHEHTIGVNAPPRATTHEEWLRQNEEMDIKMKSIDAPFTVEQTSENTTPLLEG